MRNALIIATVCSALVVALPVAGAPRTRQECFAAYEQVQTLMKRSRLLEAREASSACLSDSCPTSLRADCGQWLKDIDARMPSIVVECRRPNGEMVRDETRVLLDGAPWKERLDGTAAEVDPGDHTLRIERGSAPAYETRIVVHEGQKAQRVAITLPEAAGAPEARDSASGSSAISSPPKAEAMPTSVWILGGAAVLTLGGFAVFAVTGKSAEGRLEACSPRCSDDVVGDVRVRYITADVFLAVSAVLVGAAAYLALSARR
jgi:hypothetical protein